MFLCLLLSSVAVLTLEVNKADFYDFKCEWHVFRPQQQVSKGKIFKKICQHATAVRHQY